jgi:hypothetical protein
MFKIAMTNLPRLDASSTTLDVAASGPDFDSAHDQTNRTVERFIPESCLSSSVKGLLPHAHVFPSDTCEPAVRFRGDLKDAQARPRGTTVRW